MLERLRAVMCGTEREPKAEGLAPRARDLVADLGALSLFEVSSASALAGLLFRGAFGAEVPHFPRHFVLVRRHPDRPANVVGYVHHTRRERFYLAGGLVVAAMEFRRLDAETAGLVRRERGMAEWVMRTTCGWLDDADAVFAYIGDAKSITVNTRVGFRPTSHKYLHVMWQREVPEARREALVREVAAIGPF